MYQFWDQANPFARLFTATKTLPVHQSTGSVVFVTFKITQTNRGCKDRKSSRKFFLTETSLDQPLILD